MLNDRQHAQSLRRLVLTEYKPNDLNDEPDDASWPWLGDLKGERSDKKSANKFMLGAILDYQIRADVAWENARRLAENEFGDPVSLWEIITSIPKSTWNSRFKRYSLHRFPKAHERVWRIGREIVQRYGGDARRIWDSQPAAEILERLIRMRVGPQISRMIVGALYDTGQIKDLGDLKADLHVRRVLGRVFTGRQVSAREAHRLARMVVRGPTWPLDQPLYSLGKTICKRQPICERCYLNRLCARGLEKAEL